MKEKPSFFRVSHFPRFLAVSFAIALAPATHAATKVWNTTTGSLSAGSSWLASGTPVTTDEALFDGAVTPAASINTAAGTNLNFGDLIWNNNTSSILQMNTTAATSTQLRLTGGGGSTAATANGGAAGDLIVMGTNATSNTLTISEVNPGGGVSLRLRLDASGNFNVVNSGATLSIQTVISESGVRSLTKTGAGTLILGSPNTYSGGTILSAGTLGAGSSTAFGTGVLAINGGALAAVNSPRTLSNAITVGGNLTLGGLAQSITLNGTVDLGNAVRSITLSNSATFGGVISNGGLTVETSSAARSLTLNGAGSNTYTGLTSVNGGTVTLAKTGGAIAIAGDLAITTNLSAGTVTLGAGDQIASTRTATIGTGGTLDLATFNQSLTGVVLNGGSINGSGTLTGLTNAFDLRTGSVAAKLAGSVGLTKSGSGTVTLSGANTFTGTTTLAGGLLNITGASSLGSGTITTSTNSTAAKIALDAASASSVTLANAVDTSATSTNLMTFTPTSGKMLTLSGLITGSGILKVSSGGDLVLGNSGNSYSGGTEIGTGRIFIASDAALGTGPVNFGTGSGSHLVATADLASSRAFTAGSGFTANIDTNGHDISLGGVISDQTTGANLTKLGSGTLTLGNANTYTGTTTVSAGTLLINGSHTDASAVSAGGYGSTTTGHFQVESGATLGGTGSIAGNSTAANSNMVLVKSGGVLAPGGEGATGTLTLDGGAISGTGSAVLNMAGGSIFDWQLGGDGSTTDLVKLVNYGDGDLVLNSNAINLSLTGTPANGTYTVDIFGFYSDAGATARTHALTSGLAIGSLGAGITSATIDWDGFANDNKTIGLTYTVFTAVPEPTSALAGLLITAGLLRRRRA